MASGQAFVLPSAQQREALVDEFSDRSPDSSMNRFDFEDRFASRCRFPS